MEINVKLAISIDTDTQAFVRDLFNKFTDVSLVQKPAAPAAPATPAAPAKPTAEKPAPAKPTAEKPAAEKPAAPPAPPAPPAPATQSKVSKEELRAKVREKSDVHSVAILAELAKYGAKNVSSLGEQYFDEVYDFIDKLV